MFRWVFFPLKINVCTSGHRQCFLIEMLVNYGLDEQTAGCTENWLSDWAQRVEISGATSSWRPVLVCTPGVNTGSRPDQLMMIWMIEQSVLSHIY